MVDVIDLSLEDENIGGMIARGSPSPAHDNRSSIAGVGGFGSVHSQTGFHPRLWAEDCLRRGDDQDISESG